jgi:polysaccharide biosynthesis transport protein
VNESWRILKRYWLLVLATSGVVVGLGALYNSWQKPLYEAKGKILLQSSPSSFTTNNGTGAIVALGQTSPTSTAAQAIAASSTVRTALSSAKIDLRVEQAIDNLRVNQVGDSSALEVSYRDTDAQRATQIVQKLMETYLAQDLAQRKNEIQASRSQLEQQLPVFASNVKAAEANLRKFKEDAKVADLTAEKKTLIDALSQLNREITETKAQLAAAQAQSASLTKVFGRDALTLIRTSLASESAGMQQTLAALKNVEEQLAYERTRFQEDHPTIKDLKSKQTILRQAVQRESQQTLVNNSQFQGRLVKWQQSGIQNDMIAKLVQSESLRDGLEKRLAVMDKSAKSGQERLATFPKLEEKMRVLEGDVKTANKNYELLTERLKSVNNSDAQTTAAGQIINPAIAGAQPVAVPHSIPLGWLLGGGLLLGSGAAFGLDRTDRRLKSVAAAQQIANYPMLGCIPSLPSLQGRQKQPLLLDGSQNIEPFRMLQSNLRSVADSSLAHVVVVTSATKNEGKSTVAAHLAIAAAQNGQKVLLVDSNLRQPRQHQLWQVSNGIGLSSVLKGETQFPESVVEVAENLELMVAGTTHPNPAALFSSPAMAELMANWFSLYDLVVIDTTTLTQSAETTILAKMAHGLVLVVRPELVEEAELKQAQDILAQSQQKVLGMALNGVQAHEHYKFAAVNVSVPSVAAVATGPQLPPPQASASDSLVPADRA